MTDHTIQNFQHFLKELEKSLSSIDELLEEGSIHLKSIHILHGVMSKMFENWSNQLEHQ